MLRDENPTQYSQMVQVGRGLGAEAVHMTAPLQVPVSNDPVLTRPLEVDAAQLSQLTVDELRYRISLRTGDMSGLHLPKAILVSQDAYCSGTYQGEHAERNPRFRSQYATAPSVVNLSLCVTSSIGC